MLRLPSCARRVRLVAVAMTVAACGARTPLDLGDVADGSGGSTTTTAAVTTGGAPTCAPGDPPVELATGFVWPYGLSLDGGFVYFTDYDANGGLYRVPKSGGSVDVLASFDFPDGLATDGAFAYLAVSGENRVAKVPLGGGPAIELFGASGPTDVVLDDANVFVTEYLGNAVVRAAKAGGAKTTLASGEPSPFRLALTPTRVAFSTLDAMGWVDKNGGAVTHGPSQARHFATDGETTYASVDFVAGIVRIDPDGTVTGLYTPTEENVFIDGIALDGDRIYFAELVANGSRIGSIRKDGTDLRTHAEREPGPFAARVAVDESCVYATFGGGSEPNGYVLRAPKE